MRGRRRLFLGALGDSPEPGRKGKGSQRSSKDCPQPNGPGPHTCEQVGASGLRAGWRWGTALVRGCMACGAAAPARHLPARVTRLSRARHPHLPKEPGASAQCSSLQGPQPGKAGPSDSPRLPLPRPSPRQCRPTPQNALSLTEKLAPAWMPRGLHPPPQDPTYGSQALTVGPDSPLGNPGSCILDAAGPSAFEALASSPVIASLNSW